MFFWLLLILAILGQTQADEECNGEEMKICYIEYLANFLLPALPSPPPYSEFAQLYLHTQRKGWQYQEQLCGFQEALIKCMENNHKCLKASAFQKYLKLGEEDAKNYSTDYLVHEYECGPGKNSLQNMYFCYLKVVDMYHYELDLCNRFKEGVVSNDGYNCSDANEYVICITSVFSRRCGTAVKPFICNVAVITIQGSTETDVCDMSLPRCSDIA